MPNQVKNRYLLKENSSFSLRLLNFFQTNTEKTVFKNIERQDFLYGFVNNEDKSLELQNKPETVIESILIMSFIYGFIMAIEDPTLRDHAMKQFRDIINFSLLYKLQV